MAKVPISQEGKTEVGREWISQGEWHRLVSRVWEIPILIIAENRREIRSADPL